MTTDEVGKHFFSRTEGAQTIMDKDEAFLGT